MLEWLGARTALGISRGTIVYFLLALIAFGIVQGLASTARTIKQSQTAQRDAGAASQRAQDLETTLTRTEEGNAARIEIRDPRSRARYDQCLRSARTPENCQRFMPE